jgi:hypothetical protein
MSVTKHMCAAGDNGPDTARTLSYMQQSRNLIPKTWPINATVPAHTSIGWGRCGVGVVEGLA